MDMMPMPIIDIHEAIVCLFGLAFIGHLLGIVRQSAHDGREQD